MPSLYAHNTFGKKVIKNLPEELKKIIRNYPDSFRIGLQGPDSLFYYKALYKNKINQTGVKIHNNDAYPFFNDALSIVAVNGYNSACHSYILGFMCHFALDRFCHPYVNESMESTGCGHIEIEGDFDRYLLEMDNKIPHKYRTDKLVPTDLRTSLSVAAFYPNIPAHKIHTALLHMKLFKRLFVAPGVIKRNIIDSLFKATLHYDRFNGHMIMPQANNKCRHCSKRLYEMLLEAVPLANNLIEEFEEGLIKGTLLPDNFHGNFYG